MTDATTTAPAAVEAVAPTPEEMSLELQAQLAKLSHTPHDWNEAMSKIDNTHNLTIRQLCQMLKADRRFVNEYIVPHFANDIVRLGTGLGEGTKRSGGKMCSMNWAFWAWMKYKFTPKVECVFLPRKKILDFLQENIASVTRQTAPVRLSMCVADNLRDYFFKKYKRLTDEFRKNCKAVSDEYDKFAENIDKQIEKAIETNVPELVSLLLAKRKKKNDETDAIISEMCSAYNLRVNALTKECFTEDANKAMQDALVGRLHRKTVKAMPASLPAKWYDNVRTVADIVDYGDTDEIVYRDLFDGGAIRIELALPHPKEPEKKSKKVLYCISKDLLPEPPAFAGYEDYDDIHNATAEFASRFYAI